MREDNYPSENRLQKTHKSNEKNQVLKASNGTRSNVSAVLKVKSNSSWGANIVKGLTADKKVKPQPLVASRKLPLAASDASNQKIGGKVKRSLVGDFPCSAANAAQVHPQVASECNRMRSSRDLLLEVDHLRILLNESKERELKLKDELAQCTETSKVADFEGKVQLLQEENERLVQRLSSVEGENRCLSEQIATLSLDKEGKDTESSALCKCSGKNRKLLSKLEMEVVELRRVNKELQLQKRDLTCKLSSAESQLASLAKMTETDLVAKAKAEASVLRHTNENLSKQVEGLQMSRLTEVEELVYLRWVNSCLRNELQNSENHRSLEVSLAPSPKSLDSKLKNFERNIDHGRKTEVASCVYTKSCPAKIEIMNSNDGSQFLQCKNLLDKDWSEDPEVISPRQRRHSISGTKGSQGEVEVNKRRQSDGFTCLKDLESEEKISNHVKETQLLLAQKYDKGATQSPRFYVNKSDTNKITVSDIEKRALRIPNPPPRPSDIISSVPKNEAPSMAPVAPPPPPPPPPKVSSKSTNIMQRAPQVVELYHSLMRRESRKDASGGGVCDAANIVADVRSSMIGEIENRSSHLLAIKADVETQGEFVNSLIREVNNAVYRDIEDVVAFVKWLDDELCFLVDERAVLKHFEWPEKKADTLREAAFGYRDLKKLEAEISYFEDDRRLPADIALKKMVALSEKMERSVYVILRTREALIRTCKEYQIPSDWMLDTGLISKIKFASVKLAKKYMKRVAMELQSKGTSEKDPALEYMLLQGVRFAFRIHQFAGGFDSETMHAFEELRNLAHIRNEK